MGVTRLGPAIPTAATSVAASSLYTPATKVVAPSGYTNKADYYGNGTADNVAIQAAIDAVHALGGGTVLIKAGTYIITAQLTTYSNITIMGDGQHATILDSSGFSSNIPIIVNTGTGNSDYVFRDFGMKGRFTAGTGTTYATAGQLGITISSAKRVLVSGCYFEKFIDATVIGVKQSSPYNDSVGALNIQEVIFENNFCYDCVGGLQGYAEEAIIWNANQFEDIADDCCAFLGAVGSLPRSKKAVISNNIFKNGRPTNTNGVSGVGILAKLDGGGFGTGNVIDVSITGNLIESAYHGIYLANCSQVSITGNVVDGSYLSAVYLIGSADKVVIVGNQINNSNSSGNGSHAGILTVSCNDLLISDNQVVGTSSGAKQGFDLEGTYSRVICSNNAISNVSGFAAIYAETVTDGIFNSNLITGTPARGIFVSGTNIAICDNVLDGTFSSSVIGVGTVTTSLIQNNIGFNPIRLHAQGSVSGTPTFNRVNGNVITATLTGNITPTFTAGKVAGDTLVLVLIQDVTGGRTATWPSNFKRGGGTLTLTTTASATDVINLVWDGSNWNEISRIMNIS